MELYRTIVWLGGRSRLANGAKLIEAHIFSTDLQKICVKFITVASGTNTIICTFLSRNKWTFWTCLHML